MTTEDREDLYQQAYATYAESHGLKTREMTKLAEPGLRAVVDLVLDECAHPAVRPDWEVLREAADLLSRHHVLVRGGIVTLADRLEAEHQVAQEKAAVEAAREKLIEQAARVTWTRRCPTMPWEDAMEQTRYDCLADARVLYDAGLLVAPETTDGGAA